MDNPLAPSIVDVDVDLEKPKHHDPWNPVLLEEVDAHELTVEQDELLQEVLKTATSDSRFAQKAYAAIKLILAGGVPAREEESRAKRDEFAKFRKEEK